VITVQIANPKSEQQAVTIPVAFLLLFHQFVKLR
jgi:hypothetical protein